ncbi:hypothetical protein EDF68_1031 [Ochrobactrum sp. BH3]|nr:hypothetical protein EDF68_1031 [Ochrobactrum sp. BH3]
MPWVRFSEDFDWKPLPQVTIAYKGSEQEQSKIVR